MRLTREQAGEIIRHLDTIKPTGIICPICGNRRWNINDLVIESREFQNGNLIVGGKSAIMPFVSITCQNCANTMLLNAIQLGVVNRQPDQNMNSQHQTPTTNEQ